MPGALLAALVAFSPSFAFVLLGAAHFDRLRAQPDARAFLDGAGPAAIGAILGSAVALADALTEPWQAAVLAAAAVALLALRRGVVATLVAAGAAGALIVARRRPRLDAFEDDDRDLPIGLLLVLVVVRPLGRHRLPQLRLLVRAWPCAPAP